MCLKIRLFFTKIYKLCMDMCIVSILQDSCNLDDSRRVGV